MNLETVLSLIISKKQKPLNWGLMGFQELKEIQKWSKPGERCGEIQGQLEKKMKAEKAELAGEMSGHMFFSDRYFGFDDATYAACRLLEILSTTGRTIIQLHQPTSGKVFYEGKDLTAASNEEMRRYRRELQIIFQDPYASLNPRMTVGDIVSEAFAIHKICKGAERDERVRDLLTEVGLKPEHMKRHPHEFSGGQRQRIGIARGIALRPRFIVCDEPVSALDVSIQAQILRLLKELKQEFGLSYIFISHDLSVVDEDDPRSRPGSPDRNGCIRIGWAGEMVERALVDLGRAVDVREACVRPARHHGCQPLPRRRKRRQPLQVPPAHDLRRHAP
mgnify:CR=1 FL=1